MEPSDNSSRETSGKDDTGRCASEEERNRTLSYLEDALQQYAEASGSHFLTEIRQGMKKRHGWAWAVDSKAGGDFQTLHYILEDGTFEYYSWPIGHWDRGIVYWGRETPEVAAWGLYTKAKKNSQNMQSEKERIIDYLTSFLSHTDLPKTIRIGITAVRSDRNDVKKALSEKDYQYFYPDM